jgi:hypothetical protein
MTDKNVRAIRGGITMALFSRKRLLPYVTLATVATISAVIFQNCSQVAFTPAVDGILNAASIEPLYADGKMGETTNLPDLKLFFIIDNSHTMSSSNIKLSDSFADLFAGTNSNSLSLFNTEVSVISTAQNLNRDVSKINRNMPLVNSLLSSNYAAISTLPKLQLTQSDRGTTVSGRIPGDLIGIELTKKLNSLGGEDILIRPAPVAGLSDGPNGTVLFESSIKKPVSGSVSSLNSEFKSRLDLLNPTRNEIVDSDLLGEPMSQESGLCALARILKNSETYMKPSDIVSFVVVSDEDDAFSSGAQCLEAFKKALDPNAYISGTCNYQETKLSYKVKNTKIDYTYQTASTPAKPGIPAKCTVTDGDQFALTYNIKKTVSTTTVPYSTVVNYYLATSYTQDNIVKVKYDKQAPKTVAINLDGKCDSANLKSLLPANTEYTVAAYKPACAPAVAGTPVTNSSLVTQYANQTTDTLYNGKISLSDTSLASVGLTASELTTNCGTSSACYKTKLPDLLKRKDSRLNDAALLVTDISVKFYSAGSATLSIFNNVNNLDVSSTVCDGHLTACRNQGLQCAKSYTAAVAPQPATDGQTLTASKTVDEVVTSCDALCSGTSFCASTPTKTIREYIQTADGKSNVVCKAYTAGVSGLLNVNNGTAFNGGFSCLSQCKDTAYCPSEGTKLVKDYLQGQLALSKKTFDSCSEVVDNKSVAFTDQPGTYQCAKGELSVNGVNSAKLLDRTEYVSGTKPEGGVAKELIPFITDKTKDYFKQNKPFFNFFVMQPEDQAAGRLADQQTVGASYNKLSAAVGGRNNSILLPSYSSSLKDLSEVIKARVGKSIYFPQVEQWQKIHSVWVNDVHAVEGRDWNASGSMVTFTDAFRIERLDHVKIEYY